ncbi:hypothetical protein [Streptomyces specialis]|uniref:hypothetical protein n=1 Tax=Streptomyces specialis TaxID=498367 RepID=UPI00073E9F15|nr:hypothetical protein [Streptomyces specialis]
MTGLRTLFAGVAASCVGAGALVAGSVVVAAPAQAGVYDCQQYLESRGYDVGPRVTQACEIGAKGAAYQGPCVSLLGGLGVISGDAVAACGRARAD